VNPPAGESGAGPSLLPAGDAPPAGAGLLAAMQDLKPVKTRRPALAAALLALISLGVPAGFLLVTRLRPDLEALPMPWVAGMAAAWAMGLLAMLLTATLPRRGEVLPDTARAGRITVAVTSMLILLGLFATVDAPGHTNVPPGTASAFARYWWHCVSFSVKLGLPLLIAGGLLMRRLFPMGGIRVAAALGAVGGAAAGLTLHFKCNVGGALHVGLAHAGGVAVGALLGMLLLPRLLRN
jgi:hypothetical protein